MGLVGVWALPATTSVRAPGGGGQDAPGHRLITLGPAPVRADDPVEQDQLQRPGRGAFGQHRQVTGGNPAVPAPQPPVVGQRPAGQERPDHGREVFGPFQGQAGELQGLHERPDQQRVLPHAAHLAEQQQAGRIERLPGRGQRRRLDHQPRISDGEFSDGPTECVQRRDARHAASVAGIPPPASQPAYPPVSDSANAILFLIGLVLLMRCRPVPCHLERRHDVADGAGI